MKSRSPKQIHHYISELMYDGRPPIEYDYNFVPRHGDMTPPKEWLEKRKGQLEICLLEYDVIKAILNK